MVTVWKLLSPRRQAHPYLPSTPDAPGQGERLLRRSRCGKQVWAAPLGGFSPPASPWPCFWLMIALLLFSVRYNSSIFYNRHLFIDTRSLDKEFVYRMIRHPPAHIPGQLERLKRGTAIHIPHLLLWKVFCDFSFGGGGGGGCVYKTQQQFSFRVAKHEAILNGDRWRLNEV